MVSSIRVEEHSQPQTQIVHPLRSYSQEELVLQSQQKISKPKVVTDILSSVVKKHLEVL